MLETDELNAPQQSRKRRSVGGPDGAAHSRGTGAPPAPPPSPAPRFSSLRLPGGHPHQRRCPGRPGSAPTACRSPCVYISDSRKTSSELVTRPDLLKALLYPELCFLYLQIVIKSQLGELILQMDSEVHVFDRVNHNVDELHAGDLEQENKQTETSFKPGLNPSPVSG